MFNQQALELNKQIYTNQNGDTLSVDLFKFYLSSIELSGIKKFYEPNSYHLINAEDQNTLSFTLKNIPEGNFNILNFNLGIDSLTNVSGAMAGDLDPIKAMYWAWNTGYIAAKIEGRSNSCKTLHNAYEFHIGGYLYPYNSLRKVSLIISDLKISSGQTTTLEINADVAEWFKGPQKIELSKTNNIVLPNQQSVMIADNYSDMFSVQTVGSNSNGLNKSANP